MRDDRLELYADVNVLMNALLAWHGDEAPIAVAAQTTEYTGDPSSVMLSLIGSGELVNGRRLVLHSSRRVLLLTRAKLREHYGWADEPLNEATLFLIGLVRDSDGIVCRDDDVVTTVQLPGLTDQEDVHRFSEAARCGANLLLTNDDDLLSAADPSVQPFIITPRSFVQRYLTGSA